MTSESREPPGKSATAAVVVPGSDDRAEAVYRMYELRDMLPSGAHLGGPYLLEIGEKVLLELALGEEERVRVNAQVIAITGDDSPGVMVSFTQLGERERELIDAWIANAS